MLTFTFFAFFWYKVLLATNFDLVAMYVGSNQHFFFWGGGREGLLFKKKNYRCASLLVWFLFVWGKDGWGGGVGLLDSGRDEETVHNIFFDM